MNELTTPKEEPQWAIVELMGHVRMAGRVSEEQRFGVTLGRIDVPDTRAGADPLAVTRTQLFSGSSIYRVTYCTEEAARQVAGYEAPAPHRFQLTSTVTDDDGDVDDYPSEDEERELSGP